MQLPLLRPARPQLDARFHRLRTEQLGGGAWISHQSSWLDGDTEVFTALALHTRWRDERRPMYDRVVDVPRQVARLPQDGPGHPVLLEASALLSERFGRPLTSIGMNHYRDGRDSMGWHADDDYDAGPHTGVASLSLGAARRFRLRSRDAQRRSLGLDLGPGSLLFMGPGTQSAWQHALPRTARAVGPRLNLTFRHLVADDVRT